MEPRVDPTLIEQFYDAMFRHAKDGNLVLRAFNGSSQLVDSTLVPVGDRQQAIDEATRLAISAAETEGNTVFCPPIASFYDQTGARQKDVCEAYALSIDLDEGSPPAELEKLAAIIGPPTVVVRSGGKTHNDEIKLHAHWRLDAPAKEPNDLELLKQARRIAVDYTGADRTNIAVNHPLRWPGSLHKKAAAVLCEIKTLNIDVEINLYRAFSLLEPLDNSKPKPSYQEATEKEQSINEECAREILEYIDPDCSYFEWLDVLMALHHEFRGEPVGLEMCNEWSSRGSKYQGIEDIEGRYYGFKSDRQNGITFGTVVHMARQAGADISAIYNKHGVYKLDTQSAFSRVGDSLSSKNSPVVLLDNEHHPFDISQDQLAIDLSNAGFRDNAKFVNDWGKWLLWNGQIWEVDNKKRHMTAIRDFIRNRADRLIDLARQNAARAPNEREAAQIKRNANEQAKSLKQNSNIQAVESLARSNAELAASPEQFDSELLLLGSPGGTIDLRTGKLDFPDRNHLITKQCAVTPSDNDSPKIWQSFLERIFDGDQELISFMQRAAGYALTGYTNEHKLLFLFGTGSNGKSVFLNTIYGIMGDYSKRAPAQTFLKSSNQQHPTDLAGLRGARLVAGSELPAGRAWNESVIKDLTSEDEISARFMRQDFFDYKPQFTLFIAGNHRPSFSGIDEAIRRRVCLVPFTQTIPAEERDLKLSEKLKSEWPDILRWMIKGAMEWQKVGLSVPESVIAASTEYLDDEDTLADFINENIETVPFSSVSSRDMYGRFKAWQIATGVHNPWTQRAMSMALKERGYSPERGTGGARCYKGVSLKDNSA